MKTKFFLTIIIILAGFIRLYHLNILPPSLYYDEIDSGYQARIFNQNQTDYYGNHFPIHFHSFGDFRTSLNIYATAIIQKIIPDPDISVRLPSAIFGILSVLIIYFIAGSTIPSFLVAISPWAIHYSRIGFEASGMVLCLLLGIWFWQKFTQNQKFSSLYLSVFFFCLSPYFYSTAKLFLIFLAVIIIGLTHKQIFSLGLKKIIFLILFSVILLLPMGLDTIKGKAGFRFQYISIFTQPHREQIVDALRFEDAAVDHPHQVGIRTSLPSKIFHNKYQLVLNRFAKNYFSSFSTDFLFLHGDLNIRHGFGGNYGLLYLLDLALILIGLVSFFLIKKKPQLGYLFFWLLLLSPLPSSLTRDTDSPHATRLILMLPSIIYFTYLGIQYCHQKISWSRFLIIPLYLISFFNFWHYYNYHYPNQSAREWDTGMKETTLAVREYASSPIVFSDSYISFVSFFLYYFPYHLPQNDSIENHLTNFSDESFSGQLLDNRFYFGKINWSDLSEFPLDTVFVVPKTEYQLQTPDNFKILKIINKTYTNQEEFYVIKPEIK